MCSDQKQLEVLMGLDWLHLRISHHHLALTRLSPLCLGCCGGEVGRRVPISLLFRERQRVFIPSLVTTDSPMSIISSFCCQFAPGHPSDRPLLLAHP